MKSATKLTVLYSVIWTQLLYSVVPGILGKVLEVSLAPCTFPLFPIHLGLFLFLLSSRFLIPFSCYAGSSKTPISHCSYRSFTCHKVSFPSSLILYECFFSSPWFITGSQKRRNLIKFIQLVCEYLLFYLLHGLSQVCLNFKRGNLLLQRNEAWKVPCMEWVVHPHVFLIRQNNTHDYSFSTSQPGLNV